MTSELNRDDLAWTAQSVRVEDFRCDIVFHLSTGIQFCDAVTGHIIPGKAAALPMPDLPIIGTSGVAASTLVGREQELVGHYRSVVATFARHGRAAQLQRRSPYFWLKPAIIANGTVLTECLWYDTVPEAEELLRALVSGPDAPDGELWDDLDQGWQMRIVKSHPNFRAISPPRYEKLCITIRALGRRIGGTNFSETDAFLNWIYWKVKAGRVQKGNT